MWGVGIMFMTMGSTPYFTKRVGGVIKKEVLPIYRNMFKTGLLIFLLYFVSRFFNDPFNYIIPVLPVLFFSMWVLFYFNNVVKKEIA